MMKLAFTTLLIIIIGVAALGQSNRLLSENEAFHTQLLQLYRKIKATPEEHAHLNEMTRLPFFPFDTTFRVHAVLDTVGSSGFIGMKTSLGHLAMYRRYGYLSFTLEGRFFRMPVYQAKSAVDSGSDELFFPFTDNTNGDATYGGGRYIDLHIPKENKLILDFNRAYNPYCAYSHRYSCEIPPRENHFDIGIEAGVKY